MAKLLVVASLLLVVNLVAMPIVFGHGLMKKDHDRSSKPGFCHDDPPWEVFD